MWQRVLWPIGLNHVNEKNKRSDYRDKAIGSIGQGWFPAIMACDPFFTVRPKDLKNVLFMRNIEPQMTPVSNSWIPL